MYNAKPCYMKRIYKHPSINKSLVTNGRMSLHIYLQGTVIADIALKKKEYLSM